MKLWSKLKGAPVLLSVLLLVLVSSATTSGEIVLVVNASSLLTDVSSTELRRLWLGKAGTLNDNAAIPCVTDDMPDAKAKFFEVILKKTEKQVKKYFIKEGLKGGAKSPEKVANVAALCQRLMQDPSAIGFGDRSGFDAQTVTKLKFLAVDGKESSDQGYVLK